MDAPPTRSARRESARISDEGGAAEPSPDAVLIRRTLAEIAPIANKVTSYFYALVFSGHPEVRGMFPAAMDTQRDRLLKALLTAAEHIDNPDVLAPYLRRLRVRGTASTAPW